MQNIIFFTCENSNIQRCWATAWDMSVHNARTSEVLETAYHLCYSQINLECSEGMFHIMEKCFDKL